VFKATSSNLTIQDDHRAPVGAYFCELKLLSAVFAAQVALDLLFGIASSAPVLTLRCSEHISFDMDWLLDYCGIAPRSVKSASCWVTTILRRPKSTSK
jgi:hypothetical protein